MEKKTPLCALLFLTACSHMPMVTQRPKNVVFVVVDGMGPEQVKAGRIFNSNQKLSFENFPYQSTVTTHNISGEVTDSAAAATAMATGQKVENRVISPGKTMLEHFKEQGKSVGIATNTLLTDATPAAFAAHAKGRSDTSKILNNYLKDTQPNFIAGADEASYLDQVKQSSVAYRTVRSASELKALQDEIQSGKKIDHVYAGFGMHALIPGQFDRKTALPLEITGNQFFKDNDIPHISDTAAAALDILSQNQNGFFLLIESGLVDWIGHKNSEIKDAVAALGPEMLETSKMVQTISEWAAKNPDTLVVVTADHETGGLKVDDKNTDCLGQTACQAKASWTSAFYPDYVEKFSKHTGVNVGVYATGPGAEAFSKPMDNTQFISKILGN